MFSGKGGVENPDDIYEDGKDRIKKTNKQAFKNRRAQAYWLLRDRMYRTWRAVTKNEYIDPDELISFSSEIKDIHLLRAELCRVPQKKNNTGLLQIMSKDDMKALKIDSPNLGDSVMMLFGNTQRPAIEYSDYGEEINYAECGWMA
jgi:phage terminase large subunit